MRSARQRLRWKLRDLVRAALLTGCRYGELTRLRCEDFHPESGTVTVQFSKAGKPRHVGLTDEGQALFGRPGAPRSLLRPRDGKAWGPSHQQRPIGAASARARIEPPATFHILRHTFASALASYVADTVRAALPPLGIVDRPNVTPLRRDAFKA